MLDSEISYDAESDSWRVIGRDRQAAGVQESLLLVPHPGFNATRSWRPLLADNRTQAAPIVAIEPQQVSDPTTQMPEMTDYRVKVEGPAASRPWNVNPGTSARVLQGGGVPVWLRTCRSSR